MQGKAGKVGVPSLDKHKIWPDCKEVQSIGLFKEINDGKLKAALLAIWKQLSPDFTRYKRVQFKDAGLEDVGIDGLKGEIEDGSVDELEYVIELCGDWVKEETIEEIVEFETVLVLGAAEKVTGLVDKVGLKGYTVLKLVTSTQNS